MSILAFLQNQWFRDPEAARDVFARHLDRRNDLIRLYLFMGCLTGRRLRTAFGDLCEDIVWEECSPEIGGKSSAAFPADLEHMRAAIMKHCPIYILAFGKTAIEATRQVAPSCAKVLCAPHPAARGASVPWELRMVAEQLKKELLG